MVEHPPPIEVFLSYAPEDKEWVQRLLTHLSLLQRQQMISTWYDRVIAPGTDWAKDINHHLEEASIILFLVSANFLASDYCYQVEMTRALERDRLGQARVIPIALRPVDWSIAPFAYLQALPSDARPITTWSDHDEALVDVVAGIRRAIEDLSFSPASSVRHDLPTIWNIPYSRNSFFLGRNAVLEQLYANLHQGLPMALSQSRHALSGLGGIGKTQLAVEYAYRYHQDYEAVLWARAESEEALRSAYFTLATLLKLPECNAEKQKIIITAVKGWLQTHQKWLLILDNADDLDVVPPFLPPTAGGHILLTTREQDMQNLATRLEVETFSNEQGAIFLLWRAGRIASESEWEQLSHEDRESSLRLAYKLGGLPLALDQAGAYKETRKAGMRRSLESSFCSVIPPFSSQKWLFLETHDSAF